MMVKQYSRTFHPSLVALLCLVFALGTPLSLRSADQPIEGILDFHSDILVQDDGTMVVAESIRIWTNQQQIRHGILRDFPTHYTGRVGEQYVVGFQLLGVTRDGAPEEFHAEDYENGKRIKIGSADTVLPGGEHTYVVTYTTNRQLGFFPDHDELYWNVTGNGWVFRIEHASATVRLPARIPSAQVKLGGYTGAHGSRAQDFTATTAPDGSFEFRANSSLGPGEGLTIFLIWPKGFIAPPSAWKNFTYFLDDNRLIATALGGLLAILASYVLAGFLVNRAGGPGTIVVNYEPPPGLSPAALRYFLRQQFDTKTFTCAVINMAVKGFLKIKQAAGVFTVSRIKHDDRALAPEERLAAAELFKEGADLEMTRGNSVCVGAAIRSLLVRLQGSADAASFTSNWSYRAPAFLLYAAMLVLLVLNVPSGQKTVAAISAVLSAAGVPGLIYLAGLRRRVLKRPGQDPILAKGTGTAADKFGCLLAPLSMLEFFGIFLMWYYVSGLVAVALLCSAVAHIVFSRLLRRPSPRARQVLDRIEGFKMFLGAVEGPRLDRAEREAPSKLTPAIFEKFLPYAIALDLEHVWAKKFARVFAAMRAAGQTASDGYSPEWYSGDTPGGFSLSDFQPAFSDPFSHAVEHSVPASPGTAGVGIDSGGWSGDSGGGGADSGSSGGGGGGGGGSGW